METGLFNALTELASDIFHERKITGKDYGFASYLSAMNGRTTAGAMAAVMSDYMARHTAGRTLVEAANMAEVVEPRSDRIYFKTCAPARSIDANFMPRRYFSLPLYGEGDVLFHDEAPGDVIAARAADRETFENEVRCLTDGDIYAEKLQQHLLKTTRAKVIAAIDHEHRRGCGYRLQAVARMVNAADVFSIHRELDRLDLPMLCALLSALGAIEEFDFL